MNIGSLVVSLGIDASELYGGEAAMLAFSKRSVGAINAVNASIKQLGMSFRTFGWLATTVLTAPLVMFGKASFKAFQDYEYAMAKIQALTSATAQDVKGWSKEVLKLGPNLAKPPLELAEALYFITSSGIRATDAMNVLTVSAKAASSGLGETKQVADLLTSALNAYKNSGLTATHAAEVLIAGVREGKAEATGFATSVGSIIPIASQLGVSLDEVVGGMAAITLTGASAANASTYLRNMLMRFIKPAAQSEEMLRKMGSSSAELRDLLKQPGGLMKAMERIKELTDRWGVESLGKVIPNIRGILAFLSLMGQNLDHNRTIMQKVADSTGDLNKAFNVVSNTTKFKLDAAVSSLKVGMISFGDSLKTAVLPIIQNLAERFNRFVDHFNSLDDASKRTRLSILAFAAMIGPLSLLISVFLSGLNMLIKAVVGAAEAFTWLRVLMISNPWVTILTGVAAGTIAFIHYKNKMIEAAAANTEFAKTLVTVNGELKNLKGLTSIDYSKMSISEMSEAKNIITKQHAVARENLLSAYERAGVPREAFTNARNVLADPNASKQAKKEAEDTLNRVGRYKDVIDILSQDVLRLQSAFTQVNQAMDDWGKAWEDNAKRKLLEGLGIEGDDLDYLNSINEAINEHRRVLDKYNDSLKEKGLMEGMTVSYKGMGKIGGITPGTIYGGVIKKPSFEETNYGKILPQLGLAKQETEVMANLRKELAWAAMQESLLGDSFDETTAQLQAHQSALQTLWDQGLRPGSTEFDNITEKVRKLNEEIQNQSAFEKFVDNIYKVGQALSGVVGAYGNLVEAQKQRQLDLIDKVAKQQNRSDKWVSLQKEKIEEEYIKRQQAIAIALATMNAAVAITKAFADYGYPFGLAIAALTAIETGMEIATIKAQGLAQGGIIPPGYPNDTYPARMTSGEIVTPPGKLEDLVGMGGEVIFTIHEDVLYGILERRERRVKSYK